LKLIKPTRKATQGRKELRRSNQMLSERDCEMQENAYGALIGARRARQIDFGMV